MLPEELLKLIAAGDQIAFREFYGLFTARVYNTCLSYLQNEQEAEEATQDVFIEIFNAAQTFRSQSTVATWVYRIAINKSLDRLRYRNRQKRFAFMSSLFNRDTGALMHDKPTFDHPGVVLEHKEKAAYLFKAIKELPESQQTAFILKQVEGLSQKEVGEIMGMTEKAVESLLQRAKTGLRKILGDFYNGNEGF